MNTQTATLITLIFIFLGNCASGGLLYIDDRFDNSDKAWQELDEAKYQKKKNEQKSNPNRSKYQK